MRKVDMVIRNGRVIDTYQKLNGIQDIAVDKGMIVSAENVEGTEEIDASGCIVTPGLIDYHAHLAYMTTELGILPDAAYFPTGVTTAVDAGSTGVGNYLSFRAQTEYSQMRIKAYLNICTAGLTSSTYHENIDPAVMNRSKMLEYVKKYSDQLLGFKVRQSREIAGELGLEPMKALLSMAGEAGCGVVVHTTNPPAEPEEIAGLLRAGDVYAHVYQGKGITILRDGKVRPQLYEDQKRGVCFDAANGGNHFGFQVAKAAMAEGFLPDIISTDITTKTLMKGNCVFSLPFVMSKYIALGMEIPDIIERVTQNPARQLGEERNLGSLSCGTEADIVIHRLIPRKISYRDFSGEEVLGEQLFKTEMTVRHGRCVYRQIDF